MKRRRLHILRPVAALVSITALMAWPAVGQPAEGVRLYEEGTQRLEAGNYTGAVDSYNGVLDLGVANTGLYYNLGVAYYRLDQLGESIRFFERARRLAPGDRRIAHNLEIARSRIPDRFSRLPVRFWTRGWQTIVTTLGIGGLFGIGLVFWFIPFGLVAWSVYRRWSSPWIGRIGWSSGLIGVVFVAAALTASVRSPFGNQAVILDDITPLYSSAAGDEAGITLYEGLTVDVEERDGEWMRIRLPNGVTGWVEIRATADV